MDRVLRCWFVVETLRRICGTLSYTAFRQRQNPDMNYEKVYQATDTNSGSRIGFGDRMSPGALKAPVN